jgi:hypothetical protein
MASFSLSDIVKVSTPFAGPGFDIGLSGVEVGETWEGAASIEFAPDILLAEVFQTIPLWQTTYCK